MEEGWTRSNNWEWEPYGRASVITGKTRAPRKGPNN